MQKKILTQRIEKLSSCKMPGIEKKSLTHVKKDSMVWVQEEDGSDLE